MGDPMWPKIKLAVNRCKRVWQELMDKFGGDWSCFFKFFTKQVSSHKQKAVKGDDETTVAYYKLVQAISHCDCDLQDEQENVIYHGNCGWFLESRWQKKWGMLNHWEIWWALGKEEY